MTIYIKDKTDNELICFEGVTMVKHYKKEFKEVGYEVHFEDGVCCRLPATKFEVLTIDI